MPSAHFVKTQAPWSQMAISPSAEQEISPSEQLDWPFNWPAANWVFKSLTLFCAQEVGALLEVEEVDVGA